VSVPPLHVTSIYFDHEGPHEPNHAHVSTVLSSIPNFQQCTLWQSETIGWPRKHNSWLPIGIQNFWWSSGMWIPWEMHTECDVMLYHSNLIVGMQNLFSWYIVKIIGISLGSWIWSMTEVSIDHDKVRAALSKP